MTEPRSVPLRTRAALGAGVLAGRVSRVLGFGAGAQISGRVVLALAPDAVDHVANGWDICVVSGTNGKTTTTRLIASAMDAAGVSVSTNETGANMEAGFVLQLR